jgi:hypothetical protein
MPMTGIVYFVQCLFEGHVHAACVQSLHCEQVLSTSGCCLAFLCCSPRTWVTACLQGRILCNLGDQLLQGRAAIAKVNIGMAVCWVKLSQPGRPQLTWYSAAQKYPSLLVLVSCICKETKVRAQPDQTGPISSIKADAVTEA